MKQPPTPSKATLDGVSETTGRDAAVDFTAKESTLSPSERNLGDANRFCGVMGAAVVDLWGDLPQPIQEQLFERAVVLGHHGEQDEMLREQLAKFLHDNHKRTAGGQHEKGSVDS
jgi:hypothetical protein